jgi:tRNA threonylcarbamoyladenosine biosynthesis protein TsaB
MWILAMTTSTAQGGVALGRDDTLVDERDLTTGMIHGRELHPTIDTLLKKHQLAPSDLGLVAVDQGPGSYTGTRVGVVAAKGLSYALRIPIVGVCSLGAMAQNAQESGARGKLVALIDAKWKQVYAWQFFLTEMRPVPVGEPEAIRPDLLRDKLDEGTLVWGDNLKAFEDIFASFPQAAPRYPRARDILKLGVGKFQLKGAQDPFLLEPLYLRPTEAEARRRGLPLP